LSSFEKFAKHEAGQRLDVREGETSFISRITQGSGQTMTVWSTVGINVYLLIFALF